MEVKQAPPPTVGNVDDIDTGDARLRGRSREGSVVREKRSMGKVPLPVVAGGWPALLYEEGRPKAPVVGLGDDAAPTGKWEAEAAVAVAEGDEGGRFASGEGVRSA